MPSTPAPPQLEPVREFVNTYDAEDGTEMLDSPAALRAWLHARGLLGDGEQVGAVDVERATALREALRAILLHHGGLELDPEAGRTVEDAARRAQLSVRFGGHGEAFVEPLARGADAALGRLLAIIDAAQREGTWSRLKVCPADDCLWAFYDTSRNRSGRWCDMAECGNRAKVRAFRERVRETDAG